MRDVSLKVWRCNGMVVECAVDVQGVGPWFFRSLEAARTFLGLLLCEVHGVSSRDGSTWETFREPWSPAPVGMVNHG